MKAVPGTNWCTIKKNLFMQVYYILCLLSDGGFLSFDS